jgi:uncharacterized protein (DUF2141 family)
MKRLLILFAFSVSVSLILHSCANIAAPKGGPKDEKKPKVVRTFPINNSTKFRGKRVMYVFNEWIDENKLKEQLIITPRLENYETSINKNTLTIKFDTAGLKKNTTYYINLREGIKDLTEGNKTDSTTLVFSTGEYLDSIELKGNVKKALENTVEINNTVNLYEVTDTFDLVKSTAVYQTKTELNGNFNITNIKPGKYFVYAFKDENNNGKFEPNKEYIAYESKEIDLNNSLSSIYLNLVKEDHEETKIKFIEKKKKNVNELEFNKEIKELKIKQLKGNGMLIFPYINGKKVKLYPNEINNDSTIIEIESKDELNNIGKDTVGLVFNYTDTSRTTFSTTPSNSSELEPKKEIEIQLSRPYKNFNKNISLKLGRTEFKNEEILKIASIVEDKQFGRITLIPKNEWNDTIKITIYPTSFEPVSGYFIDTIKLKYIPKSIEKYGSIGGKIECNSNKLIIELTSKEGKIIKQIFGEKNFLFNYLTDGEYKIRVIEDINENKKWDQGDYRTRTLLEPIHHYPDVIKLKSSWEILDVKLAF